MTTWTMTQVRQAEGLRARLTLDIETVERGGENEVLEYAAGEMTKQLIQMGHPFGIELHPGDFEVQWTRDADTPWRIKGEARWRPSTPEVELRGGPADGQRYAVRRVGDPIAVARPVVLPWQLAEDLDAHATLTETSDTYRFAGWREDERVWVYEAG